ncbi:MAG: SCO family protein [Acidobacteria bacterium]|nr:SCO family protein [Acidobacteriota bacterium]
MRHFVLLVVISAAISGGCSRDRRYPFTGQVLAVRAERQEITVKHEDVRGFMPAMTMPFRVKDAAQLASVRPGDLITATLVVQDTVAHLEQVAKTGTAPLPADMPKAPLGSMIAPGAEVPGAEFTDQDGHERRLSDWRGKTIAVTFVYTRCPLPDFCPLMDRHFAAVQRAVRTATDLADRVHLLSVSFDPDFDTPAVLKRHAERAGANPASWSYLTGQREGLDKFAAAFGVTILREEGKMDEIIHNLRTAVIDRNGRLVTVLNGNDWQPEQLIAELRAADAGR